MKKFLPTLIFSIFLIVLVLTNFSAYAFTPTSNIKEEKKMVESIIKKYDNHFKEKHHVKNFDNQFFKLFIPKGMTIMNVADNNMKIQSNGIFYQLHPVAQNIDIEKYFGANFDENSLSRYVVGENITYYIGIKVLDVRHIELTIYGNQLEVITAIRTNQLHDAVIQSIDLIKNFEMTNNHNLLYIGQGNTKQYEEDSINNEDSEQNIKI